ncbi:HAMP domain-containing histidine kinase [Myxococcus llanfairpwllgwyngyllgogerychwyrndrobwllllantysiliogogogochensis]|uniref:histidine kinase n=1 Tax=Myxococcus llanfairpwllgwyngyllgogerychwyrndrobwllllantysiliogogogochensis TaxID=2590453 RepID=A0A540WLX6_9BACT|nr:HAMP domain-containing histidine kinase [Myxococcus llanfairpwllgwyngyllgogerychwyrndrobwllllantysiliogogogochensis]
MDSALGWTHSSFDDSLARAVDAQRRSVLGTGAAVRLVGATLFLILTTTLWLTGGEDWSPYPLLLVPYVGVATVLFVVRNRPEASWLGIVQSPVDVALVYGLQHLALPISPFPAGVAGFSLGLFALVVTLSGLALRPTVVYGTAALSSVAQAALMREAGVGWGAVVIAVVTLMMVAAVKHYGTGRVRVLAVALTRAEVDSALEARRFQEVEEARRIIARMLDEEHEKNDELRALQHDKELLTQFLVHDLRSPLSALTMTLAWMEQELPQGHLHESARTGLAVTARLDRMITDMMDVPRLEQGRLEPRKVPLDMGRLLEDVRRSLENVARARKLTLDVVAPRTLALHGDPELLVRVVENLATNALRYAPTGGRVRLEGGTDAQGAWLAVRNDGPPIPGELRARLFDKYVQGDQERDNRRGYGLGLYFSRLAAEAHGGTLSVEDTPDWPTSFVLRLPTA